MSDSYAINAELFLRVFKESLEEKNKKGELIKKYTKVNNEAVGKKEQKLSSNKQWTKVMESIYMQMEKILNKIEFIGSENYLNLYCKNYKKNKIKRTEHMHIDATFFDERESIDEDLMRKSGLGEKYNKIWNLLAAIEHENSNKDNIHEVKQLLQTNTPLRVLITYSNYTDNNFDVFIENYFNIFKQLEEYTKMCPGDEFLLIFGNSSRSAELLQKIIYKSVLITCDVNGELDKKELNYIELI